MHLFFDAQITPDAITHFLTEEESLHACKVMRLKDGDSITVLNGKGLQVEAEIKKIHPKRCEIEIIKCIHFHIPDYDVHIAIAPTKMNDRLEWFVEKAIEIGITEISFLNCYNSERKHLNLERIERIAIAALKQSKRTYLPRINGMIDFNTFIDKHKNGFIAHCEESKKNDLSDGFKGKNTPILIGPEGDFSSEEILFAMKNGYKPITLGSNRLRTETAGIVACVQAIALITYQK
jgi:16S rRNA (uracil1498-N3)-methyltransferase